MGRRDFLLSSLAAVTAGLAGCGGLGGSESADYEPSAADNLAVAVGQLNKAALSVEEFQSGTDTDSDGDRRRRFDASEPRDRVTTAREALSRATDNGAEQADVEAVSRFADGVEGTVDAVASVTTASNRLAEVEERFDSGGEVDTDAASATLSAATTASSDSRTAHGAAETALAEADPDRLRALDAEYNAVNSGLGSLLAYIVGVDGLSVGYDTYVDGVDGLQTAQDQVDTEEYGAARTSFSTARTTFTDAASEFTDARGDAAEDIRSDLTEGDERSRALNRLAAGYVSLLDSRDHVTTAESSIEAENNDAARTDLTAGSEDATTAESRFEDGSAIRDEEFDEEFRTAQNRATAMDSLAVGYGDLVDGRDHLEDGESAFVDERYDVAATAFGDAEAAADRAETTFSEGDSADGSDLFDTEFERAFRRASVLRSLGEGYGLVVQGRQTAQAGREELRGGDFEAAETRFRTAAETFADAERVFTDGQAAAGETFGPELDRALCRVGHLRDATDHLIAAAQAGGNGDRQRLESEQTAAEDDITRAEEC